jgi:hypothetical protein
MTCFDRLTKLEWSQAERDKAAKDAVELTHMSHHPFSEVKAHVKARAEAIGAESELPEDW